MNKPAKPKKTPPAPSVAKELPILRIEASEEQVGQLIAFVRENRRGAGERVFCTIDPDGENVTFMFTMIDGQRAEIIERTVSAPAFLLPLLAPRR